MDSTLLAAIIGACAAITTAIIAAGSAVFRDRLAKERAQTDRLLTDVERLTTSLDKAVESEQGNHEKAMQALAETKDIARTNAANLSILLDRMPREFR